MALAVHDDHEVLRALAKCDLKLQIMEGVAGGRMSPSPLRLWVAYAEAFAKSVRDLNPAVS